VLAEEVTPKRNERVLIIGDMNCFVDHEDAISTKTPPSPAFQEMIEQLQLSDAWRLQNPVDITHASFVRTMRQPGMPDRVDRSRIDHAFVNDLLLEEITECKYGDFDLVVSPDHCPIIITLSSADANIPTSSNSVQRAIRTKIRTEALSERKDVYREICEQSILDNKDAVVSNTELVNQLETQLKSAATRRSEQL
jgi:hypothetical protein